MQTVTHEAFVHAVAASAIDHGRASLTQEELDRLGSIKLVYGSGLAGTRGVTFYGKWAKGKEQPPAPFVEVSAFGQESWIQVAGTTIHELGHVVTGPGEGHGPKWKDACRRLGLRRVLAAGTDYKLANFDCALRFRVALMPKPNEGEPLKDLFAGLGFRIPKLRACPTGIGSKGGKSRGAGSGSRLRLFECECPVKVRVARDEFHATCNVCEAGFHFVPSAKDEADPNYAFARLPAGG